VWYEKLNIQVDIDQLRADVEQHVFPLGQQIIQGEDYETKDYHGFGGWSLQSRSGDWRDGWEFFNGSENAELKQVFFPDAGPNYKTQKYFDIAHSLEHKNPTQACVGEIKKVLEQLDSMGLYPRRARVSCLQAHSKSLVHKDGYGNEYMARIHIPVITNKKCIHICEGENLHMPADGSVYIMWVNTWHQIRNDSDQDRYHIIMDAYDVGHVTEGFRYTGDIQELEQFARTRRQHIEQTVITPEEFDLFERTRQKYITKKVA
jgi:hypothetical protein